MCGIAGWLGVQQDATHWTAQLEMDLKHRGPDASGIRNWPNAALVHRRLSIVDLSPAGDQPMGTSDGRVWVVFNGEIYNHHELRHQLEAKGYCFRGRSDTEVIPYLYLEEGIAFVRRLRGMFAFALYDRKLDSLFLARDRFGIKPLFYAPTPEWLAFSSEIRPLRRLPRIDTSVDRQALSDYTALLFVPAPATFFRGISALEPGSVLEARYSDGRVESTISRFHEWSLDVDESLSLDSASKRAESLLTNAVGRQLESDVPLGSLLSGGIDSSLVSWAAQDRLGGTKLSTFNVRFSDSTYDETDAAITVARHIGSAHRTLDMRDAEGTWDSVVSFLRHEGQPFADTSVFAAHAVSRLMRQNVSVALSGDGGDEGFGGYDFFHQIAKIARWQQMPRLMRRAGIRTATAAASAGFLPLRIVKRAGQFSEASDAQIVQQIFSWVPSAEQRALLGADIYLPVERHFESVWDIGLPRRASRLERLSAHVTEVNARLILPNDFLFKVDIASMRESLEIRVPMLDEELFAFGLSLPHRLKVNRRTAKLVLRKLASRALPDSVARKPKWGFGLPLDRWVSPEFRRVAGDSLLASDSPLADYYDSNAYRPIVEAFTRGKTQDNISRVGAYQRVMMLLSLYAVTSDRGLA